MEAIATNIQTRPIDSVRWAHLSSSECLFPEATWTIEGMFNKVNTINHPFLQAIADTGAVLTTIKGDWTIFAKHTIVALQVGREFVNIECISTVPEERGKGSATMVMNALTEIARKTNTELRLRACAVVRSGQYMMMPHPAIAMGGNTAGKIPVPKLRKWYEKFGFCKVSDVFAYGKRSGVNMIFKP